jgi:SAM-dependent methyltransferase
MHHVKHAPAIVHVDSPPGGVLTVPASGVHGWIAAAGVDAFERAWLVGANGDTVALTLADRPDVHAALPDQASVGFTGSVDARLVRSGPCTIRYERGGTVHDVTVPLEVDARAVDAFIAAKQRKLARVRALLRCPMCSAPFDDDEAGLACATGHRYPAAPYAYDLLDEATRRAVGAVPTDNVSSHGYDPMLLELLAQTDGPVLDAGCGLRPDYREDVVNLEIVPYITTDVVAAGEYLPFADASFELVISVAVLEHVRDPFAVARELQRVLRPDGRIFAAVPFLQPYHAYPDHYYNMTAAGLRNLFTGCEVERLFVPQSGGPIFLLTWVLQAWRAALPPEVAHRFDAMRVADLAVDPMQLLDEPFVRELPEAANVQLAAMNVLVGRKRA